MVVIVVFVVLVVVFVVVVVALKHINALLPPQNGKSVQP